MKNKLHENIQQWYLVKPFACILFADHPQEMYWIKNAWLYLWNGLPENLHTQLTIDDRSDELSDDVKRWLLALYELYWGFKNALDFDPYDYDFEAWAQNIGLDMQAQESKEQTLFSEIFDRENREKLTRDIAEKQHLFIAIIKKELPDHEALMRFMISASEVMPFDLFLESYCTLHEEDVKTYEEYCHLNETAYRDYRFTIEIDMDSLNAEGAREWVLVTFK